MGNTRYVFLVKVACLKLGVLKIPARLTHQVVNLIRRDAGDLIVDHLNAARLNGELPLAVERQQAAFSLNIDLSLRYRDAHYVVIIASQLEISQRLHSLVDFHIESSVCLDLYLQSVQLRGLLFGWNQRQLDRRSVFENLGIHFARATPLFLHFLPIHHLLFFGQKIDFHRLGNLLGFRRHRCLNHEELFGIPLLIADDLAVCTFNVKEAVEVGNADFLFDFFLELCTSLRGA